MVLLPWQLGLLSGSLVLAPPAALAEPERRPGQLQLGYPARCQSANAPGQETDSAGRLLRQAFEAMGEWQCGWQAPDPRWHDWTITLWGGAMTDGNMGDSLLLNKGFRSEALAGVGVQGTIWNQRRLGLIVDANLIGHRAMEGGTTPGQSFGEATLGLGLRFYPSSWLSFTVVEGMSGYSERSKLALRRGGNGRRLVNYLAFEVEAAISEQLSVVARLHHRSGIYGTIDCAKACDNNGYLLGLRYNFAGTRPPAPATIPEGTANPESPPPEQPTTDAEGAAGAIRGGASGEGVEAGGVHGHLPITESPLLYAPAEQHNGGAGHHRQHQGGGIPGKGTSPE